LNSIPFSNISFASIFFVFKKNPPIKIINVQQKGQQTKQIIRCSIYYPMGFSLK